MSRSLGLSTTVVAVDWSGARAAAAQRAGICVAIANADGLEASAGRTRDETVELIEHLRVPVVVGFDFSFGVPEWFARNEGCETIDDVWALAARDGEGWLRPTPPFWRDRCAVAPEHRFRRCELALAPAKSIFQLVGNGQVGAGSVRGMPLLARLRASGFAIWPFDPPGPRTALEIYPSRLRRLLPEPEWPLYTSVHERDAVESARVMWEQRESFTMLRAATDPVTRIEGDVWMPDGTAASSAGSRDNQFVGSICARPGSEMTNEEARWLALDAQGLAQPRPKGPIRTRHLQSMIRTIGQIQLDAINVLERTQFVVPFSRLGPYDPALLHDLTGPGGELFEYWGHAVSLLPTANQPLFRWRMEQQGTRGDSPTYSARREEFRDANADYIAAVLREVRELGPLSAGQLSDPRRRDGEWWQRRSLGRVALEYLFIKGELAGWRSPSFERVYDLPERVIPRAVLDRPTPAVDAAERELLLSAARSQGVATLRDLANYYVIRPRIAKVRVVELVDAGELVELPVEGWTEPGYAVPNARPKRPTRTTATLLSPFDSLIWERSRTLRLFGFDYRIEVYTPEPKRKHGYFVLPLLLGDQLVARFDLKADRRASVLQVRGSYLEPAADASTVAASAATELDTLRGWLHLRATAVARRGNLATAVRRALG